MLSSRTLLLLVLLAWLIYAEKCAQFMLAALRQPDHSFLHLLNNLPPKKMFGLLYRLQLLLFLPITVYSLAILGVAIYKGWVLSGIWIIAYILALCLLCAARYQYQLQHPGKRSLILLPRLLPALPDVLYYWKFFIQYLFWEQRLLLAGVKIFSCGVLYLSVKTLSGDDYDPRMPSLLFGIGLFGHGVLVYRLRELEEKTLLFYRGLPVSLSRRLAQYGLLYGVVFIPELITIACLTPRPLHYGDAFRLLLSGYGFLLFLNSLLFITPFTIRRFLKIVLGLFLLMYFAVMGGFLGWLAIFILPGAVALFCWTYYRYNNTAAIT
jgi:hypothetical protein